MKKTRHSISLQELAGVLEGELAGENIEINDVSGIDDVKPGEITWVEGKKSLENALASSASALVMNKKYFKKAGDMLKVPCIIVKRPRLAFAQILNCFYTRSKPNPGTASTALVGPNTVCGENVSIGEYAVIGKDCNIGEGTIIYPLVYIGDNVKIGKNTIIYPFVAIHNRTEVGKEVIIHSGTVIGADGFGFVEDKKTRIKIPQVGKVMLGDYSEIGANVTIDRATTGITSIGEGTKIDNLIQVGHNNNIGKNCVLVSQVGIAGSCTIGDNVTFAAQSGVGPHVKIGANTVVAGRGGVTHDIPKNSIVSGFPARPHREALRISGAMQRLPILMKTIKDLERRIEKMEQAQKSSE
ncbi:MAG: UDP-3-O-(3-hydroxymyristoyl)glucosamine N-acyltransferase [Candidatus Eremiobacteraeota bacterium]|nr:UDP-3-O-(3-hydroxymyristoyl)glucosamine N-acyltransferase [Candidatus Eremiobacteraeota bacterium]